MSEPKRLSMVWVLLAALICVVIVFDVAYASGDEVIQSNDMNAQTAGDINNRSYGFGHSLGDIDLNQCMGSTQWSTIIVAKQKLVLNKWCAAESYDARGLHHMAAIMRCDIPDIAKHFTEGCIAANTMMPAPAPPPIEVIRSEEDDERIDHLYALVSDLEAQRQSDADNARKSARRPIPQPQIVQQPLLSDEQRIKLQAVLDER